MTREEFAELLGRASNPDTSAEALLGISDGTNELFDAIEAAQNQANEDAKTIAELRDANTRLFQRIGVSEPQEEEEHEETLDEMDERLRKEILG